MEMNIGLPKGNTYKIKFNPSFNFNFPIINHNHFNKFALKSSSWRRRPVRRISLSTTSKFFLLAAANDALSEADAITKVLAASDGVFLGSDLRYWPPALSTISRENT